MLKAPNVCLRSAVLDYSVTCRFNDDRSIVWIRISFIIFHHCSHGRGSQCAAAARPAVRRGTPPSRCGPWTSRFIRTRSTSTLPRTTRMRTRACRLPRGTSRLLGLRSAGFETGSLRTKVRDSLHVLETFSTDSTCKHFNELHVYFASASNGADHPVDCNKVIAPAIFPMIRWIR